MQMLMIKKYFFSLSIVLLFSIQSSAQEISVMPGIWGNKYFQYDDRIDKTQLEYLLSQDPEANKLWKKSKRHNIYAWTSVAAQLGCLVWFFKRNADGDSIVVPLVGAVGFGAVGIGYAFSTTNLHKEAILLYNKNVKRTSHIQIGPTYNGYGLVLSF